jgi:hypothetical protein
MTENEELIQLTDEIIELLSKNAKAQMKMPKNQHYFHRWMNEGVYDIEEDVYPAIQDVIERVKQGKLRALSFPYIDVLVKANFKSRTGTPSVDELLGNLNKRFKGYDE